MGVSQDHSSHRRSGLTLSHVKILKTRVALLHALLCPADDEVLDVGGVVYVRSTPLVWQSAHFNSLPKMFLNTLWSNGVQDDIENGVYLLQIMVGG